MSADPGSYPVALQSQIDSARIRLEDQQTRDRQWTAERLRGLEDKIDSVGDTVKALVVTGRTIKWMVGTILPLTVGAAWALGRLIH